MKSIIKHNIIKGKYPLYYILFILCYVSLSCNQKEHKILLTPIDTIFFEQDIININSLYNNEYNTIVNTYRIKKDSLITIAFCIDSIKPTSVFRFNKPYYGYIYENKENALVNKNFFEYFIRIDTAGKILDTTFINLGKNSISNDNYFISTIGNTIIPYIFNNEKYFLSEIFLESEINEDKNIRAVKYNKPIFYNLKIGRNFIIQEKGFGKYPKIFSEENSRFLCDYYDPRFLINNKNEIVYFFPFIDSIYVIDIATNNQKSYYLNSKYKNDRNKITAPDSLKIYDFNYQEKYIKNFLQYLKIFFDSYRNYYYIIVIHPMNHENEDGTFTSLVDAPWSLMILDTNFNILDELKMPDNISKYGLMINKDGIAMNNKNLNTEKNKLSYIIYKIEEK